MFSILVPYYFSSIKIDSMKKVLLTTDFSENARSAIEYGLQLFGSENVQYTLLNTYKEPGSSTAAMVSIVEYLHQESKNCLAEELKSLKDAFPDFSIETLSLHGSLYPVVNGLASKGKADYVVIGTRGASQIQNFFLGSNTMDALKNVQIPTVIVPTNHSYSDIDNIALAVDFKPLTDFSPLDPVVELARAKDSKISAFHVQENDNDTMTDTSSEIQRLFEYLGDITHQFDNCKNENVAAGIGNYMKDADAQILAIVARKHNFLERLFQKSITKEVSLLASFPMLVVREK